MGKVLLSEFVEPELSTIWEYIALDNPDAADRFLDCAQSTLEELSRMPGMGRQRHFRHRSLENLRSFRIKDFENYLIFYRPIPAGIEVFHVLHGARDLDKFWER